MLYKVLIPRLSLTLPYSIKIKYLMIRYFGYRFQSQYTTQQVILVMDSHKINNEGIN